MLFVMDVTHNRKRNRFEVALGGGEVAELSYTLTPGTLSITHTYVPSAARGQGVAGRITRAALEYARSENLEVVPVCSYAAAYLARQESRQTRLTGLTRL